MTNPQNGLQAGAQTASSRRDAVKQAFNMEYQATMKAMANAADRAKQQILDQRLAATAVQQQQQAAHQAHQQSAQQSADPTAPDISQLKTPLDGPSLVMMQIAAELRKMISQEVDKRMTSLANQVEAAIKQTAADATSTAKPETSEPDAPDASNAPAPSSDALASSCKEENTTLNGNSSDKVVSPEASSRDETTPENAPTSTNTDV